MQSNLEKAAEEALSLNEWSKETLGVALARGFVEDTFFLFVEALDNPNRLIT